LGGRKSRSRSPSTIGPLGKAQRRERFFEETREEMKDKPTPPVCEATPDVEGIATEYGNSMPYSCRLYKRQEEIPR
jgi:hypothetical protein